MNQEIKVYNGCFYGNNDYNIYAMQKPVQGDFSDLSEIGWESMQSYCDLMPASYKFFWALGNSIVCWPTVGQVLKKGTYEVDSFVFSAVGWLLHPGGGGVKIYKN